MKSSQIFFGMVLGVVLLTAAPLVQADDSAAGASHDGLKLVKKTKHSVLYVRPGASLKQYDRLAILECPVAFRKNWERDENEQIADPMDRVTKKDMDRIKSALSEEFKAVFTKELQDKGGYKVVKFGAKDVLVLRPAIIDLDVAAPDDMTPGMQATFTTSAGSMTLYLELYDSVTNQILARYVDAEGDLNGMVEVSNRVTNKAAADRILRRWADKLRKALDDAHKTMSGSPATANK